jgi:hypothetical protein
MRWWVLLFHHYSVVKWRHFHASIRGDCTIQELFFNPSPASENLATSEFKERKAMPAPYSRIKMERVFT